MRRHPPLARLLYPTVIAIAAIAGYRFAGMNYDNQVKLTALVVVLAAIVTAVFRPALALALVVALAPFEFFVTALGIEVGTNEILVIIAAFASLPLISLADIPRPLKVGAMLIVIGSIISSTVAISWGIALWGSVRWLCVVILLMAAFRIRPANRARNLAAAIVSATSVVVLGFALLQKAGVYFFVGAPYLSDRIDSTFGYYTVFGAYMAMAALIAINQLTMSWHDRTAGRVALHAAGAAAGLVGVVLSLSRGAALALGAGLLWLLLANIREPRRVMRVVVTVFIVGLIGFAVTPASARKGLSHRISDPAASRYSDLQRFALRRDGLKALEHHQFGIGYGNFPNYLRASSDPNTEHYLFHAHWLPVQIGLDAGWLGLIGFALLVLSPLAAGLRGALLGVVDKSSAGFAAALVGLLAQGWYDYLCYEISFLVGIGLLVWGAWPHENAENASPAELATYVDVNPI